MGCTSCRQRREQLAGAARAVQVGDIRAAAAQVGDAVQSFRADAGALARTSVQRLAAAHKRLKR